MDFIFVGGGEKEHAKAYFNMGTDKIRFLFLGEHFLRLTRLGCESCIQKQFLAGSTFLGIFIVVHLIYRK